MMGTVVRWHLVHNQRALPMQLLASQTSDKARCFVNTCLLQILIAGVLPQEDTTNSQLESLPQHPNRGIQDRAPHICKQREGEEIVPHTLLHLCLLSIYLEWYLDLRA